MTNQLDVRRLPARPTPVDADAVPDQWTLPFDGNCALAPSPTRPRQRPLLAAVADRDDSATAQPTLEARAVKFVQALVEIAGGDRPVSQMARWMTPQTYDDLLSRLACVGRTQSVAGRTSASPRSRVVSVRVCKPAEESAEISARVVQGERSRALAVRLELRVNHKGQGRWLCTALVWG